MAFRLFFFIILTSAPAFPVHKVKFDRETRSSLLNPLSDSFTGFYRADVRFETRYKPEERNTLKPICNHKPSIKSRNSITNNIDLLSTKLMYEIQRRGDGIDWINEGLYRIGKRRMNRK
ncbi:uncharacterized protein LOC111705211 [Eurytemora carolleeae]|uniref:uncharacterized protein LOC111705211 n=1 Tax=Eurytemora carolleeae TaxID=1294199 RepID=UPI000C75CB53|nr:uncharacterized protein LOC111705211 [Eurytemora carolleeae]|eukprot:XP_023333456.1 uncharacterized protein LOC111705211 [Eurytemora affinis]